MTSRRAEENLSRYEQQQEELEREIEQEEALIADKYDPLQEKLQTIQLKPRKTDIDVRLLALGWAPYVVHDDGTAEALFL